MTPSDPTGVFLGLDYGLRRIGLAYGDSQRRLAFALGAHVEGRDGSILTALRNLISQRHITTIILGLPLQSDGNDGPITEKTRKFGRRLEEEFSLPVILWDERYSSQEADRWLQAKKRTEKEDRDALAAEIILQSFLDSLDAGEVRP